MMRTWGEIDRQRMERVDAYLGLRGAWNICELNDGPFVILGGIEE